MRRVILALAMIACDDVAPEGPAEPPPPGKSAPESPEPPDPSVLPDRKAVSTGKYTFTRDMFTDRIDVWSKVLTPFKGKSGVRYLEVGVFEGRSVVWMLENVLTDDSAKVTAIDIFPEDLEAIFKANIAAAGRSQSVTTLVGTSLDHLPGLPPESFDIAYIDGSHTADDVLADAVLVWRLLKPGGVLIFDDFLWVGRGGGKLLPAELRPAPAVASFITAYRNNIEILHNEYQVILRKIENPCPSKHYCSPLGPRHAYLWRERKLVEAKTGNAIPLTDPELAAVEAVLTSRPFGAAGFAANDDLAALSKRIGVDLPPPVNPLSAADRKNLLGL